MPRPVGDPRLGAAVGQGQRHEGGAGVVQADPQAGAGALEELGAVDARGLEVSAEALGAEGRIEALPLLVDEEGRGGKRGAAELEGPPERAHDAGGERPRAGIVGLVRVEGEHPAAEIHVGHLEGGGLASPGTLAVQEAVEEAPGKRDGVDSAEQLAVLVRVEPALRLAAAELGHEAGRERVHGHEAEREDGQREHAVQELRNVAARRRGADLGGRERAHHRLGVVEGHLVDGLAPDQRVDVALEPLHVALAGALRFHVIRVVAGELAGRPPLAHGLECVAGGALAHLPARASAERGHGLAHGLELGPIAGPGALEQLLDDALVDAGAAERRRELGEQLLARRGGLRALAGREGDPRPLLGGDGDPCAEALAAALDGA